MTDISVILFDNFETLDVFGPIDIISKLPEQYKIQYYSLQGEIITSSQNSKQQTISMENIPTGGILLVPGGIGTRELVEDVKFIDALKKAAKTSKYILTVCTGSALLARTGLLDKKLATSNKRAFYWVVGISTKVLWQEKARWTVDGNIYTSSGITAGMDMMLGFISDLHGRQATTDIAKRLEYQWNEDKDDDKFAL